MEDEKPLIQRAPIARLPAEILADIVNIIAHDPLYECRGQYLPDVSIAISQVCMFWRNAAFGSGSKMLWTRVPLRHSAACVRAFMERSHPLPVILAIELGGDTNIPTSSAALAEAVTYMNRVERISFQARYNVRQAYSQTEEELRRHIYESLSCNAAPALKTLAWSHALDEGFDDPLALPSKLFAGHVPESLRHVRIVSMIMSSESAILRAPLTSLELGNCTVWESVDDLLDTLSCMPGLRHFVFDTSIYPVVDDDRPSQRYGKRSVNLPCLRTLCFSRGDTPLRLSRIVFEYLHIPIDARLCLDAVFDEETQQEDATLLFHALAAHYHESDLPGGLEFTFSTISIGLCGGNTRGLTLHASYRNAPCLSLVLAEIVDTPSGSAMIMNIVHSILGLPVMSRATRFNIKHSHWFALGHSIDWVPLRHCIPGLEILCISRTSLHGLLPALLAPATTQADVIFPNLRRLYFEGLTFDEGGIAAAFFFVALTRIAQHRAAHRHPLECIMFRVCSGATKLAEQLMVALPDVEVVHKRGSEDRSLVARKEKQWDRGDADIPYVG